MKKIVITSMLTLLLVSMMATTVFAKIPNPNPNGKNCFGQGISSVASTEGTVGDEFRYAAREDELTPGAAYDVHWVKNRYCDCDPPPPFEEVTVYP